MLYLASPYFHDDFTVMQQRFEAAVAAVAHFTEKGQVVYSPIAHFHPVAMTHNLPRGFDFWRKINFAMIDHADSLFVLQLDGWLDSKGVAAEVKYAEGLRIRVVYGLPRG